MIQRMTCHKLMGALLALTLAVMMLPACTTNPATGKSSFTMGMTRDQEIALGVNAEPQFVKDYGGEIPSTTVNSFVSNLGHQLAAVSERPTLPWEFHAVDSDVINAFALPGGKIFVTRGLLSKLTNEAQLAGVLGHEIGHVTALHVNQQIARDTALKAALAGVDMAASTLDSQWLSVLGTGGQLGGGVYLLKFGRDDESQADELGVRYMTKLGYNPMGQIQVMQILKAASGGNGGTPEFLSTHPFPDTRIKQLKKLLEQKYPDQSQYKFDEASYKRNVLDQLAKLPPAKQVPKAAQ